MKVSLADLEKKLASKNSSLIELSDDCSTLDKLINELEGDNAHGVSEKFENTIDNFFKESLQANSLEDLASLLFYYFDEHSCEPAVELKYHDKCVFVSKTGEIPQKDRIIIDNLSVNEIDYDQVNHKIKFNKSYIKGVLKPNSSAVSFSSVAEHLISILDLVNSLARHIGATQINRAHKSEVSEYQNKIKKLAFESDQVLEKQHDRSVSIIKSSFGQLIDMAKNLDLDDSKLEAFDKFERAAIDELEADMGYRLKLRKQFLSLISDLEN